MPSSFSSFQLLPQRWRSWMAQQLIAIDLGSSHIKVILAEKSFGQIQILHHEAIDLQQEGLLTVEEINRHLREVVDSLGNPPVALSIPQHLALSHLIDLPRVSHQDIQALIKKETHSLSGLSESPIVYDSQGLKPFGKYANPFWVTISREQEIKNQIQRLAMEDRIRSYSEITTAANALVAAYLSTGAETDLVVLANLGSTTTVVSVIYEGQPVFASSFPIAGESFTGAIASLRKCSFEEAELHKRSQDLFNGPQSLPGFLAVVDIWLLDLTKLLREWEEDNPGLKNSRQPFQVILSGGAAEQPGLFSYLQQQSHLQFQHWPEAPPALGTIPMARFAVAYGAVLQAFEHASPSISLLPADLKLTKRRQKQLMTVNWIGLGLVILLFLVIMVGSVQKLLLLNQKKNLLAEAAASLVKARATERLLQQRENEFNQVRPLVERQMKNVELLQTLRILQQVREQRDLWFVLLADSESYVAGTTFLPATNANFFNGPLNFGLPTNRLDNSNGYIVELNLPAAGDDKMKIMRELVQDLKKEKVFYKVDALAPSLRNTNLVEAKLLVPDRSFALSLELSNQKVPETNAPAGRKTALAESFPSPNP